MILGISLKGVAACEGEVERSRLVARVQDYEEGNYKSLGGS